MKYILIALFVLNSSTVSFAGSWQSKGLYYQHNKNQNSRIDRQRHRMQIQDQARQQDRRRELQLKQLKWDRKINTLRSY